jgi:hypothetical protein
MKNKPKRKIFSASKSTAQLNTNPQPVKVDKSEKNRKNNGSGITISRGILLVFLLLWIYAYLGCEPHINEQLGYPENPEKLANATGLFRASLNLVMVSIVMVFTYIDRWESFKHARFNNLQKSALKQRANVLFIPFALAVIPFITAASDLGTLLSVQNLTFSLLMAFLLFVIFIDGIAVSILAKKYPGGHLKKLLARHLVVFFVLVMLWFIMSVIFSFPTRYP